MLLKLLSLPVTLPASGIRFCLEKVADIVDAELNSEEPVKEELLRLQLALEEGEIGEPAYRAREAALLARLREIRERQRELLREEREERQGRIVESREDAQVVIEMPDELR